MAFLGLETVPQKGIFVVYMTLWMSYGLLNQHAKESQIKFNTGSAVLSQSCLKILLSLYLLRTQDGLSWSDLLDAFVTNKRTFLLYMVPAMLYSIYDVLSYVNLQQLDPPTYFLLLQLRLVITALVHQYLFQKQLNRNQWISLCITTFGCAVKTIGDTTGATPAATTSWFVYFLVLIQILASTFAGVYNELLLKKQLSIPLNVQNIFMYINSIVVLTVALSLGLTGQHLSEALQWSNLRVLFYPEILAMIVIMSCVGIVTSLFLKLLDSVRKAIASALELVLLPILTLFFFGIPITVHLFVAVICVSSGVYLYSVPIEKQPPPVDDQLLPKDLKDFDLETGKET